MAERRKMDMEVHYKLTTATRWTSCGKRLAYVDVSPDPEQVTCWLCRRAAAAGL